MQIKDVMTRDVKLADPTMTLDKAAKLMRDNDFGVLPVGENDRLVGIITDRDIAIRAVAAGLQPSSTSVREIMSKDVRWVLDDASTEDAAQAMSRHQIRRLPVINQDKRLVGIVALGDFAVQSSEIRPAAAALSGVSEGAQAHHR